MICNQIMIIIIITSIFDFMMKILMNVYPWPILNVPMAATIQLDHICAPALRALLWILLITLLVKVENIIVIILLLFYYSYGYK